jgi:hypothetical protein
MVTEVRRQVRRGARYTGGPASKKDCLRPVKMRPSITEFATDAQLWQELVVAFVAAGGIGQRRPWNTSFTARGIEEHP